VRKYIYHIYIYGYGYIHIYILSKRCGAHVPRKGGAAGAAFQASGPRSASLLERAITGQPKNG